MAWTVKNVSYIGDTIYKIESVEDVNGYILIDTIDTRDPLSKYVQRVIDYSIGQAKKREDPVALMAAIQKELDAVDIKEIDDAAVAVTPVLEEKIP